MVEWITAPGCHAQRPPCSRLAALTGPEGCRVYFDLFEVFEDRVWPAVGRSHPVCIGSVAPSTSVRMIARAVNFTFWEDCALRAASAERDPMQQHATP